MKTNPVHQNDRNLSLIFLFAATMFTSATLMFVLQPMFGKILLPLLGGSPSVWNTCMVFYQSILFLGYLYAHYLSVGTSRRHQIIIHAGIMLLSFLVLPLALPENAAPPTTSNPTWWLLWVLLLAIGLPFFVVSTTAPLLQKWFSQVGHHTSHDPYYLYTASNAGSLLALLSYPFIIEPNIGLEQQKILWSIGYILLGLLIAACALIFWRSSNIEAQPHQQSKLPSAEHLDIRTRLHWLALAFVPSSLLLGLTNFISTDIASVPLLWIIPLTLYLLSFIIVFSKWNDKTHPWMVKLQPMVLLPFVAYSFIDPALIPYWLDLCLHLLAFFLAIMVCHGELAKRRPHTRHLTLYYLIMAFAGMLGGMFNTFLAPFIFNGVYEYPIMIIAALLLRPNLKTSSRPAWQQLALDASFPVAVFALGIIIYMSSKTDTLVAQLGAIVTGLTLLAGLNYALRFRAVTLALTTAVLLLFAFGLHNLRTNTLFQIRTFFGVLSVRENVLINEKNQPEIYHELFHGTTKHGAQRLSASYRTIPLTYYSQPGPMGQLFKTFDSDNDNWRVGVVGLGAGALACYSKPGQLWTFFEIDPAVVAIAENPRYFSYMENCAKDSRMRIGDARLSLNNEPEQYFDLLVLDAFSSDAVPTHLLTRQAIQLYFAKLKPSGILAFHITNRHLSLKKVLSDHARKLGFAALIQEFTPQQQIPLVIATDWVVLARQEQTLQRLHKSRLGHWQKLPLYFHMKSWTDDFTNILSVWR